MSKKSVGDTQNFCVTELDYMENHPNRRAIAKGRRVPYHLQYLRDGKINIKPEPTEVKE